MRSIAYALLPAASLAAQPTSVEFTRDVHPVDPITAHGDEVWQTYRVIDGITGAPIPGAELLLVSEHDTPMRGEFWFDERAVGDDQGFVRMRTDDKPDAGSWIVIRAPGYGAAMQMHAFDDPVVPLAVAQDVPIRVLDWRDEPVAGALVGYCSGCGHTPDLAHAVSGADGVAVLRGIDFQNGIRDLYVEHPDLALGYESVRWFPGDPPAPFRPGRGQPLFGIVVGRDGASVAGAAVGLPDVHRGPWTRTAADGSFRLCGLTSTSELYVVAEGRRLLFEVPAEMPYRLQLPVPDGEEIQIVELGPREEPADERVDEPRDRRRSVVVRVDGLSDDTIVELRTADEERDITEDVHHGRAIEIPADVPVWFAIGSRGRDVRVVRFDAGEATAGPVLELRPFAPTTIVGRLVDADSELVRARVGVVPFHAVSEEFPELAGGFVTDGRLSIPAATSALTLLGIVPEDEALAPRLLALNLPPRGDAVRVELGDVELSSTPRLTIEGSNTAELLRPGWSDLRDAWSDLRRGDDSFAVDRGRWLGPDPRAGDAIVLPAVWHQDDTWNVILDLPVRTFLAGDGPWAVRPPSGQLVVDVRAPDGEPVAARVLFDDQSLEVDGPTLLRRVSPGTKTVFVSAVGRQTAIVRIDVQSGGRAELGLTLPGR